MGSCWSTSLSKEFGNSAGFSLVRSYDLKRFARDFDETADDELGRGITGVVSVVKSKNNPDRVYAKKSVNLDKVDKAQRAELINELKILMDLDHPNVVKLHATYYGKHNVILVMQYCSGGPLSKRLPRSERETVRVVKEVTSAIFYIHTRGICHRDVKLDNVLWLNDSSESPVVLIDFGFSKVFDGSKQQGSQSRGRVEMTKQSSELTTSVGNPFYQAPEVIKNSPYTEACDMWSLGVLTYYLISGKLPFEAHTVKELVKLTNMGAVTFGGDSWKAYDKSAQRFVKGLLNPRPRQRMNAETALTHDWLAAAARSQSRGGNSEASSSARTSPRLTPSNKTNYHSNSSPTQMQTLELDESDLVSCMKRFAGYKPLKRAALIVIAFLQPASDSVRLREIFREMDVDGSGEITQEELTIMIHRVHTQENKHLHGINELDRIDENYIDDEYESSFSEESEEDVAVVRSKTPVHSTKDLVELMSHEDISVLFRALDQDRTGKVKWIEFLAATLEARTHLTEESFVDAFRAMDVDGTGYITVSNLRKILGRVYSKKEIRSMISESDLSNDGKLSEGEFLLAMGSILTHSMRNVSKALAAT